MEAKGLAHCQKIVELHVGKIRIESLPNEGASFHFSIPEKNNSELDKMPALPKGTAFRAS